jgi:hypothetical protein
LLVCSGKPDGQWAVLEAIVHAVEQGVISTSQLEDSLARHRRAKERLLAAPGPVPSAAALRRTLGCDAHRRVAEDMAQFV